MNNTINTYMETPIENTQSYLYDYKRLSYEHKVKLYHTWVVLRNSPNWMGKYTKQDALDIFLEKHPKYYSVFYNACDINDEIEISKTDYNKDIEQFCDEMLIIECLEKNIDYKMPIIQNTQRITRSQSLNVDFSYMPMEPSV